MTIGSLVKRKENDWEKYNPWMKKWQNADEVGIIVRVGKSGYWDYEVFWTNGIWTHDESELEEVNEH